MKHLIGKRILLTRSVEQNAATAPLLVKYGATPVLFPCFSIQYLNKAIQTGLNKMKTCPSPTTDVIFSSSNGVKAVATQLDDFAGTFSNHRLVAVGNKTAKAIQHLGAHAQVIATETSQQGLIKAYQDIISPTHVFFFRADEGSNALVDYFAQQAIHFTLIPTYHTSCHPHTPPQVLHQFEQHHIDAVLLGSAKTAKFYLQKLNNLQLANQPVIAVMSHQIAQAADTLGLKVQVIANKPSFRAMLNGLNQYFTQQC